MRDDHQVYRSPQNPVRKCRRGPVNVIGGQNNAGSEEKSKDRLSHCSTCHAIPPGGDFCEISIEDPPPSVPITTKFGVDVWNHPTQRVWWSKPCSLCPLRVPTREKRHWGYLAPDIHLTRVARDQCVHTFSLFFSWGQCGTTIYLVSSSPEMISILSRAPTCGFTWISRNPFDRKKIRSIETFILKF